MGNIFQYAVKILAVTAKIVIAALTTVPAPQVPTKPTVVAEKPIPAYKIHMESVAREEGVRYFETSDGRVFIFRNDDSILP